MPNFYAKTPFCLRFWEVSENSVTRKNPNGRHISLDSEPQYIRSLTFFVTLLWHTWFCSGSYLLNKCRNSRKMFHSGTFVGVNFAGKSMEIHGNPWKSTEIHGNPWNSMEPHGTPWKSMEIHGNPRKSMEIHGNLWKSMDIHGNQWICMNMHGNP